MIRDDGTDAYVSVGDPEWRQFSRTIPSICDYYVQPGQTTTFKRVQVNQTESISVPYGGPYLTYKNEVVHCDPVYPSLPWYAYIYPSLGLLQTVQNDVPPSNTVMTQALRQIDSRGVSLFPVTPRTRWTYNGNGHLGNTWQMKMVILGQVILNSQDYFTVLQSN